ncbi:MAG: threonine/serine exporter family protein [Clostridia bacterium]|nr:threonine/serine exporter family protein [Clostridia bacterium]
MEKVLQCAMDIGEQMLICGGEVHRVEDSVKRICLACGAKRVDPFIITSCMIVTVTDTEGSSYTQTRRITSMGANNEMLHNLNQLSRRICALGHIPDDYEKAFDNVSNSKKYPTYVLALANMLMAGVFTLFFLGTLTESLISVIVGGVIFLVSFLIDKTHLNNIFSKYISALAATAFAVAALRLGLVTSIDKIIIGCIMLLIPGSGLTNGLRDLFTGDSIAGLLRSIEAVLCALAIAAGYFSAIFILGGLGA